MKERFHPQPQPESPKQLDPKGGIAGPIGVSPPEQSLQGGGSKSPERQQLPNVWDYLERQVRIHEEHGSQSITREEYYSERRELNRFEEELIERGTARDNLILDLHLSITKEPTGTLPVPVSFINLSLQEFQQFRSKVEPMSEEEIREEIRKAEEEFERKAKAPPGRSPPKTQWHMFNLL
jgi:hypothetical protein